MKVKYLFLILVIVMLFGCQETFPEKKQITNPQNKEISLDNVKYWTLTHGYSTEIIQELAQSKYQLVVLTNPRTMPWGENYSTKKDLNLLKDKLILGYLDVGMAETYRSYWNNSWKIGSPSFILGKNGDWENSYRVEFWNKQWKDLVFAQIDLFLEDGYNGIYLDDVESYSQFSDPKAKEEMIKFIGEISLYAKYKNPNFLIVVQNALELGNSQEYLSYLDGVAQESIWFSWKGDLAGDVKRTSELTDYYLKHLEKFKTKPVFTLDYAKDKKNVKLIYQKSFSLGFRPLVAEKNLSSLSKMEPFNYI